MRSALNERRVPARLVDLPSRSTASFATAMAALWMCFMLVVSTPSRRHAALSAARSRRVHCASMVLGFIFQERIFFLRSSPRKRIQ
jgi:hypothetical protein